VADQQVPTVVLIILAIVIPPLAVGIKVGFTMHLWINIALMFLTLGIGAVIHALILCLR
jgi:uncharacterized membrane protein YqaE (UPF0057 family)